MIFRIKMIRLKQINDTKIMNLTNREQKIIAILIEKEPMQSSDIYEDIVNLGEDISFVTIKRALSEMAKRDLLLIKGSGRSTKYIINTPARVFFSVDVDKYISTEPDKRAGIKRYNFELFKSFPDKIFSDEELESFEKIRSDYRKKAEDVSDTIKKKELQRLTIEFSWKSSKIEGNTYSLLDTEKLILYNKETEGHTKEEAQMILNHKDAFEFVYKNKPLFKKFTIKNLEEIHSIMTKNLGMNKGIRKSAVGITGSAYMPLDNIYQINKAIEDLSGVIAQFSDPYSKALLSLIGTSYIQPFEDGNKRTSRMIANSMLLAHDLVPLSYRSVDEKNYKNAIIVFYELNSLIPFNQIFTSQYKFSAENYTI